MSFPATTCSTSETYLLWMHSVTPWTLVVSVSQWFQSPVSFLMKQAPCPGHASSCCRLSRSDWLFSLISLLYCTFLRRFSPPRLSHLDTGRPEAVFLWLGPCAKSLFCQETYWKIERGWFLIWVVTPMY